MVVSTHFQLILLTEKDGTESRWTVCKCDQHHSKNFADASITQVQRNQNAVAEIANEQRLSLELAARS